MANKKAKKASVKTAKETHSEASKHKDRSKVTLWMVMPHAHEELDRTLTTNQQQKHGT